MHAAHFSHYFEANPRRLHFAAHSHHPWPDATQAAHARYWEDATDLFAENLRRFVSDAPLINVVDKKAGY